MISATQGALQDVKLIAGPHGYLSQCPQLDSSCPTCGQFSSLLNNVENLNHMLEELTHRVSNLCHLYETYAEAIRFEIQFNIVNCIYIMHIMYYNNLIA